MDSRIEQPWMEMIYLLLYGCDFGGVSVGAAPNKTTQSSQPQKKNKKNKTPYNQPQVPTPPAPPPPLRLLPRNPPFQFICLHRTYACLYQPHFENRMLYVVSRSSR